MLSTLCRFEQKPFWEGRLCADQVTRADKRLGVFLWHASLKAVDEIPKTRAPSDVHFVLKFVKSSINVTRLIALVTINITIFVALVTIMIRFL